MNKTHIALYGIGAFGYAILKHLDNKHDDSFSLTAYDIVDEVMDSLSTTRQHPFYHTDTTISDMPEFARSPEDLLKDADIIITAVSSDATREVMRTIRSHAKQPVTIINTAKALDKESGQRLSQLVDKELEGFNHAYALLAGGTIADDLFRHEPLGIDIACSDEPALKTLSDIFTSANLHVYTTTDLLGVEYAAALKNVISILAGIVKGLGFSYGAETHIISKTAQEIADVCINQLGAQPDSFSMGRQAWGNDMWMSCTGNTRNRQLGILLGEGVSAPEALEAMHKGNKLVEGVNTLRTVDQLPGIKDIQSVQLLHDLIILQSIEVSRLKDHLLNVKD